MTIRRLVSENLGVVVSAGILVGVLAVIDAGALGDPALALSLLPFVFVFVAAIVPLTPQRVGVWLGGIALLAIVTGNLRYAGLAFPAVVLLVLLLVQRGRRRAA